MSRKASSYATRQTLVYYALAIPAILSEVVFSIAIASNPAQLLPQVAANSVAIQAAQVIPWALLFVSLYAVRSFRPSVLITLLTVSFFVAATVTTQINFLGYELSLGGAVSLVIISSFASLIGFSYSRGAKVLAGRELKVTSGGPLGYQFISVGFELVFPLLAALALVFFVSTIFAALKVEASQLPEPLSSLSLLYLQTRFGTVLTTVAVAGATIWAMRQFLEPVILYFTISREDGLKMAAAEVEDIAKKVRKQMSMKRSSGVGWFGFALIGAICVVALLSLVFPLQQVSNSLLSLLISGRAAPTPSELGVTSSAHNIVTRIDQYYSQAEDLIRTIIRLIWG